MSSISRLTPKTDKQALTPIKETDEFRIKKEGLIEEFKKADSSKDGFISLMELKAFLDMHCLQNGTGKTFSDDIFKVLVKKLDKNQ